MKLQLSQFAILSAILGAFVISACVQSPPKNLQPVAGEQAAATGRGGGSGAGMFPTHGMVLGQTVLNHGDIETCEQALGKKIALIYDPSVVRGQEDLGYLKFDLRKAQAYDSRGYMITVAAYEAYAGHKPFNVDQLLRGAYDADLTELAAGFRSFGKPMLFTTAREPNGILFGWMGGYGPNGSDHFGWAEENRAGFAEFKPPAGPRGNPDLYRNLGDPKINDGLERMIAAQRYYHDFFKRREGLDFLLFDTMGWMIFPVAPIDDPPGTHSHDLWDAVRFETFYPLIRDYSDVITLNWHINTEPDVDPGERKQTFTIDRFIRDFDDLMGTVQRLDPNKPVILSEIGFPDPQSGEKVTRGLECLMAYPQIKGIVLWGSGRGDAPDQLIRPGTDAASAFRRVMKKNPGMFHSTAGGAR